jgi:uncharacterized protein YprB with RNaseH-like and TPR domain
MKLFAELKDLLFIDIETVAESQNFVELDADMQQLWERKAAYYLQENETIAQSYERKAALLAEFSKIIVIAIGYFYQSKENENENDFSLRIKSFASTDEKQLLADFSGLLTHKFSNRTKLVAHNGKEFDYPFLCRRLLINNLEIPKILQPIKGKSWDNPHIDTMEMWRFGDRKNYTSLRLLAKLFNITPCEERIEGSQVHKIFYEENGLDRIAAYCRCDVRTTAELYLKLRSMPNLKSENIFEVK